MAKTNQQRLNNIIGQLEGVKKMLSNDQRDCLAILIQLKAIRSATTRLMDKILESEFDRCLLNTPVNNRQSIEKIFREITKNNN